MDLLQKYLDEFLQGTGLKPHQIISPVPQNDVVDSPGKMAYVAENTGREFAASQQNQEPQITEPPQPTATPTPEPQVLSMKDGSPALKQEDPKITEFIQWARQNRPQANKSDDELRLIYKTHGDHVYKGLLDAPSRVLQQNPVQNIAQGIGEAVRGAFSAQAQPQPTLAPDADQFEKTAFPILSKYGIPPSVGLGIAAAEGGKIGSHNVYNINATDSNPGGANHYNTPESGVEAFGKLISTDPRYAKAYAARNDPEKMLMEIQNAGYAGDPKTWKQRSMSTNGAGHTYNTYTDFVKDTPGYRKYQK